MNIPHINERVRILLLFLVIIIVVAVIALHPNRTKESSNVVSASSEYSVATPAGWKRFDSKEWGLTFSYPANWTIQESFKTQGEYARQGYGSPAGSLMSIRLEGDGYAMVFDESGGGLSDKYTYTYPEYTISGSKIRAIKYVTDSEFGLFLNVPLKSPYAKTGSILIRVSNTKPGLPYVPVLDQILSTIEIY